MPSASWTGKTVRHSTLPFGFSLPSCLSLPPLPDTVMHNGDGCAVTFSLSLVGSSMTINVEYNQLDALMTASGIKDERNASGI